MGRLESSQVRRSHSTTIPFTGCTCA